MLKINRLAIFCPKIGERSETFIHRHIEDLAPNNVVVVTFEILPKVERTWNISCPTLVLRDLSFERVRYGRHIQRLVPAELVRAYYYRRLASFFEAHSVKTMLGQYLHQSWPFISVANQLGIRFFGHAHGYDLSKYWRQEHWRARYGDYQNSAGVIVVNHIMRERLLSAGVTDELIHIVPYGVDVPSVLPERTAEGACRFLAVGRMVGKKAPLKTLEAFRLASKTQTNIQLDFVGTGPLFGKVKEYVEQHDLGKSVHLYGGQPHSVVTQKMLNADCFVQHSIVDPQTFDEEGVPVAILEAMAHGLPIIATKHTGIPEAVEHGKSGFLVEEGDINSMAKAMLELSSNKELRKRMGGNARHTASNKFTWQLEKGQLVRILGL